MNTIDCHTHLGFAEGIDLPANVEALLKTLDNSGVEKAVVFAGPQNKCHTGRALEAIKPFRDRLSLMGSVSFGPDYLMPGTEAYTTALRDHFAMLGSNDLAGLKFYTGYEHFYPHDEIVRPFLQAANILDKPVVFHCGDLYSKMAPQGQLRFCHPLELDRLACEMPGLKIIMAHVGNPFLTEGMAVVLSKPNVYADVSGFVYGKFDTESKRKFGKALGHVLDFLEDPSKLMFGSDWPLADPYSYTHTLWAILSDLGCDERAISGVLGGTAAKVFGISK